MKTFEYKTYTGQIEPDTEQDILYGRILNINDVVDFQGTTISEARKAFEESVDSYLEVCKEFGKEPDKPFSGKTTLRMGTDLHKKLNKAFITGGYKSLNSYIVTALEKNLEEEQRGNLECSKCKHSAAINEMQSQIFKFKTAFTSIPSSSAPNLLVTDDKGWSNSIQ
ncbi:type II toxin-antitoxin system HicB family antitoxin [Maridesulfovibrio frigidus]|uniref:type II toxin-antitoxin system HicB family antitoxin n=1 Tax=Maridesulfovibrio frigidus TaxID=340956 RepID=UPI000A03BB41|nr:type II toxin-antitoxin system HicB family antitoxin [Maridesulfovibrio frigidus]